ncbi:4-alpha-glucanotransferase [Pararobbsia alpina]|uniref:4-alpha-glucanotransferase n=1 Tax=Pararobbsia alpina TaxID=621374 RepID=A0A6S7DBA0_9BURK|nr:4-alpha-glucanotransferase [Pararobbsia alpina]CAB3800715.1 4-alpha-glucanotransferase [Pararobbsia alpina]
MVSPIAGSDASERGSALDQLAARAGFEPEWSDAEGNTRHVREATLRVLLERLGLPAGNASEIEGSMATLDAEMYGRELPPLLTAEVDCEVSLPVTVARTGFNYRIELESGPVLDGRFGSPEREAVQLPPIAEAGYHVLVIDGCRTTLAVAPRRCYTVQDAWNASHCDGSKAAAPPVWGVAAQVYGLRRNGDGGIGDFSALTTLAVEIARRGGHALAISPMHAMFSAEPQKVSPYAPSSRLFLNVAHIDPAAVRGAGAASAAIDVVNAAEKTAALEALPLIDWAQAMSAKLAVLRALFESFSQETDPQLLHDFASFVARGGRALEDHACFESLHAARLAAWGEGHWRDWPVELRNPRSDAVAAYAEGNRRDVDFHLFMQWLASKGLTEAQRAAREAGMAIGLVADLAVGCDSAGSHAWSYRDQMLTGVSVGAPPDLFNQAGQSWGLTTFSPRAMRTQGFSAFIDMLRASFAYAGGIRIDHILGLRRLWLVPEGASAQDGAYLRYPLEDMLRLIALESWRHRAIVIGEDLGTVPPGFTGQLQNHGLLGIRVLWFERADGGAGFKAPSDWDHDVTATTTTHDLPTVSGWWQGEDIHWRARIGQTAAREDGSDPVAVAMEERAADRGHLWQAFQDAGVASGDSAAPSLKSPPVDEALAFVAATPAPLVIFPLEDLLGLTDQPNLPGSTDEHPNWRRRLDATVVDLFLDDSFSNRLRVIDCARSGSKPDPSRTESR